MDLTHLSTWAAALFIFGILFVLLSMGMWVAMALGLTGVFILILVGMHGIIPNILFGSVNSFVLMAIPMFIFAGQIIVKGGISRDLFQGVSQWTKIIPGGLVHANILSSSIFAAVSGSSAATTATIGTVAYHEEVTRGYEPKLVMGSIAAGGTLGILIPPSVIMIIYGDFVGVSIARLFIGGIVPGVILALMFMAMILCMAIIRPNVAPPVERVTRAYFKTFWLSLRLIYPMLVVIVIILGGIYFGVMTPAEAAAVSCFVALIFVTVRGKLTLSMLRNSALDSVRTSCMILLIVMGASILGQGMSMIKLPARLSAMVVGLGLPRLGVWAVFAFMYLLLGCVLEGISMMLLTLPITFPLMVTTLGYDGIWFGVLLTILIEAAQITPPVGLNLYIMQGITGKRIEDVVIGSMPFFFLMLIGIAIFTIWPDLVTFLPSTMFELKH